MVRTFSTRLITGLVLIGSALLASTANAQWRVAQETPSGMDRRIDIAIVENDSGHSLRLYSDADQNVRGIFTIRGGFDTIDPKGCPTYRVDEREPQHVAFDQDRCRVLPKQAEFSLGRTGFGRNWQLHRIMNGDNIVFRYRLGGGNYRETVFTLRGSKYALTTAVQDLEVGIDE